jgi:hypothetical protein
MADEKTHKRANPSSNSCTYLEANEAAYESTNNCSFRCPIYLLTLPKDNEKAHIRADPNPNSCTYVETHEATHKKPDISAHASSDEKGNTKPS